MTKYSYDDFGNLKHVLLPSGKHIEYLIDAQNRRIGKKVNGHIQQAYVYQSQTQIAAELDHQGHIVRSFVYGEKSNIPDTMTYQNQEYRIISDLVGTPLRVVNTATGEIVETTHFDEFGRHPKDDEEMDSISIQPFGFAGGLYDPETHLVRFGARDYMPRTGRWLSKDPLGFGGGSANLYQYSVNDPVNFIDPSGKFSTACIKYGGIQAAIVRGPAVTACIAVGAASGGAALLPCMLGVSAVSAAIGVENAISCNNNIPPTNPAPNNCDGKKSCCPGGRSDSGGAGGGPSSSPGLGPSNPNIGFPL